MHNTPKILAEAERLADLRHLQILDTAPEQSFNDLLELLIQITGCPIAMINFVDDRRVWSKALKGIDVQEAPRELSICTHTIESDSAMVVEDTLLDPRFVTNPFVACTGGMRFYAGMPILGLSGAKIGSVCVLDTEPKSCTPAMQQALTIIAQQTSLLLELKEKNRQLAQWAEERLQLEEATLHRQIQQQEAERELIGSELHENFAQSIAALLQYLSLVEGATDGDRQHLTVVRQVLTGLLNGMRQLSSAVFPIGSAGVIREEMFRQFIHKYNRQGSIQVSFTCDGDVWTVPPVKLLTLFRIMVEQLHAYELQGIAALQVMVSLSIGETAVELSIAAAGGAEKYTPENKVVENSIIKRSHLQNGKVVTHLNEAKNKVLSVQLPL